jgi:hypothetical protein
MRLALLAVVALAACTEEDTPGFTAPDLDAGSIYIPGTKHFTPQEIAEGVKPSDAITSRAEAFCPNASLVSATSTIVDQKRVGYFFICP